MSFSRHLAGTLAFAALLGGCSTSRPASPPPAVPDSAPPSVSEPPTQGQPPGSTLPTPVPTPPIASRGPVGDYRDVLKLYRANLSEDFVIDRIRQDGAVYNLSADQVIELRSSGVSERVIDVMLDTSRGTSLASTERPMPSDAVVSPRRPPEDRLTVQGDPQGLPPDAPVRWEGVVRRQPGIHVLKNRYHIGTLTFAEGQLRWVDAKDSSKNLLIPERAIVEQFRTCMKRSGGNECFEWGVRTQGGDEYRFRDVSWEQGVNDKVDALHSYFRSRFPSLIASDRPVDEK
jgi:hypothetical protein